MNKLLKGLLIAVLCTQSVNVYGAEEEQALYGTLQKSEEIHFPKNRVYDDGLDALSHHRYGENGNLASSSSSQEPASLSSSESETEKVHRVRITGLIKHEFLISLHPGISMNNYGDAKITIAALMKECLENIVQEELNIDYLRKTDDLGQNEHDELQRNRIRIELPFNKSTNKDDLLSTTLFAFNILATSTSLANDSCKSFDQLQAVSIKKEKSSQEEFPCEMDIMLQAVLAKTYVDRYLTEDPSAIKEDSTSMFSIQKAKSMLQTARVRSNKLIYSNPLETLENYHALTSSYNRTQEVLKYVNASMTDNHKIQLTTNSLAVQAGLILCKAAEGFTVNTDHIVNFHNPDVLQFCNQCESNFTLKSNFNHLQAIKTDSE